ncbi:uncharacterized protein LOC132306646 isoform X1 [Cornus florida]|uniref:uncharacterized protein LOC132306646 isoform X1 n=1 Tax=Cornus florida TaxID=4283 RepID=UPI0028986319|nr:uncharacterized protein LOC132306646 isoform X1 [Cornus florida]
MRKMAELCLSSTYKTQFSSFLLFDFFQICSFIISHPLYIFYFIFFFPYLLKLLSFLSPLFITTSLLLLAFLTLSPGLVHNNPARELSGSKLGFIFSLYNAVMERLHSNIDDDENEEFHHLEELEAYTTVFETSIFDAREIPDGVSELESEEDCLQALDSKAVEIKPEKAQPVMEGNKSEELDDFENMCYNVEEKKVEPGGAKPDKEESTVGSGSKVMGSEVWDDRTKVSPDNGREYTSKVTAKPERLGESVSSADNSNVMESSPKVAPNLGSYGSMRKDKEWKRTLACKLFEERHNVGGGGDEGMDMLWETYEMNSSKSKLNGSTKKKKKKKKKNKKKGRTEDYEEEEEEEEEEDGHMCCLQALNFSAGKVNLGMGRSNFARISKAIKGIGWLHHVSRNGKKGYN